MASTLRGSRSYANVVNLRKHLLFGDGICIYIYNIYIYYMCVYIVYILYMNYIYRYVYIDMYIYRYVYI